MPLWQLPHSAHVASTPPRPPSNNASVRYARPVLATWGAGVDSTAMLIELLARGATARPGSMTQYIRDKALLPADEIDRIVALAPQSLTRWQEVVAEHPTSRPELRQWRDVFDAAAADGMRDPPTPPLYASAHPHTRTECAEPHAADDAHSHRTVAA